jgi:hypothetical protein
VTNGFRPCRLKSENKGGAWKASTFARHRLRASSDSRHFQSTNITANINKQIRLAQSREDAKKTGRQQRSPGTPMELFEVGELLAYSQRRPCCGKADETEQDARWLGQLRVVLHYPIFDHLAKLFRLFDKLLGFGLGGYARHVVIHLVPLPATRVEVVDKSSLRCS